MLKLSIIVPVYKVEKYIRTCIESFFMQGLDDEEFEIIIINDGTPDNSIGVIEDIINQHKNIKVINQENQGSSVARNNGIAAAKGEYMLMPDPDDLLIYNSLKPLLEKALETKADLVVADFLEMTTEEIQNLKMDNIILNEDHTIEKSGELLFLQDLNPHQCYVWRTLFRKGFIHHHHLTFVPGIYYQDVPFTHECYIKAEKCLRTSRLLNIYRIHREFSATNSFDIKKAKDFCIVIAKTWELTHMKGISKQVLHKIRDDVYVSFQAMNCSISHSVIEKSERNLIIDFLRQIVPDLEFNNGFKQRLTTILYKIMPHAYMQMRYLYGAIVEDYIQPFYRHQLRRLFNN